MTDTLNRGYPYPLPTADPDVPYWLQRLAEDVDADVHGLLTDHITVDYQDGLAGGTTASRYTRSRIGTKGTIQAHIIVALGSNALPANTNTGLLLVDNLLPPGYGSAYTIGMMPAILSGMGRGDSVQVQIAQGDLYMRSNGAAFSTTSGSSLVLELTYRWDGVL